MALLCVCITVILLFVAIILYSFALAIHVCHVRILCLAIVRSSSLSGENVDLADANFELVRIDQIDDPS